MEVKVVKPKAIESTILATKEEDEKMKECVVIGQETEEEIDTNKGQETMKGLRQKSDATKPDDSKNESRSSSSSPPSSSSSSSLEMMKKLENDKNSSQNEVNTKKEKEKKKENNSTNLSYMKNKRTSSHVWDCGSTLYDSFELNSFKRQLDSAISASSARTMSMSRLPDRRIPETLPPPPPRSETSSSSSSGNKKHSNKISRSLQRFLKSVFRPKHHQSLSSSSTPSSPVYKAAGYGGDKDRYYVVYDKSGTLTTIPESTEKEVGPEMNSLVRKTVSERFPASRVVGISCA